MSIFCEIPSRLRCSALNRLGPSCNSHRINGFHLPSTTAIAASSPQVYLPNEVTGHPQWFRFGKYRTFKWVLVARCVSSNDGHMPSTQHVTFLGVGEMGSALAHSALAAGHRVTVWNRTPSKTAPLVEAGARAVADVADALDDADGPIVVCLFDRPRCTTSWTPWPTGLPGDAWST